MISGWIEEDMVSVHLNFRKISLNKYHVLLICYQLNVKSELLVHPPIAKEILFEDTLFSKT